MKTQPIIDASTLDKDLTVEADVVVVGTGAGGAVTAEILAQSGRRVVMLEQGAMRTSADFSLYERDSNADLYFDGGKRRTSDGGIAILQGRTVGGSTTVNWTASFRTPAETLNHWARYHQVEGLEEGDLAPWFEKMERRLNIQPWAIPPNRNNAVLAEGARKLGWHAATISRNVRGCLNLGYCGFGCPVDAKLSMLVTTVPGALRHGAVLVTRVLADRLILKKDRLTGVSGHALDPHGTGPSGPTVQVKAPVIVVSGGGINSPALLLNSGIPDPYQTLGKRTFLHPTSASLAMMPKAVDAYQGAPQSVYSNHFLFRDGVTGKIGFKLEVPPLHPVLVYNGFYQFGPEFEQAARDFRYLQAVIALLRDGFHEESTGGVVRVEKSGRPQLDYPVTDYLWEGFQLSMLAAAELQFAAGAKSVQVAHMDGKIMHSWKEARKGIPELPHKTPNAGWFSAHVMGGCAMGENPRSAVVNSHGRHHQVENLYVIDGSVFPTSLGVNPQLSIYALAAKNAASLAEAG